MRGGGRRLGRAWSNTSLLIAFLVFWVIASLLPERALAEGASPQSWESAFEHASYFYREGDLQQALSHAVRAHGIVEQTGTDQSDRTTQSAASSSSATSDAVSSPCA